jgi:flavin reductase (DIM6/NTAB) family NADH-FMN oxidoreductase RutF
MRQSALVFEVPFNPATIISLPLYPDRWSWEICRKSSPLGVKMTGDGFQSEMAAQFAGKRALADFLSDLSKEEKRK